MSDYIDDIVSGIVQGDPSVDDTTEYTPLSSVNVYKFMDDAFAGTGGFRDGKYLIPHPREVQYNQRRDTSYYKNFTRPIIRAMTEPVFTEEAPRRVLGVDGEEKSNLMFNVFLEDADNSGTPIQGVTEQAVTIARKHGLVFVVVDNFQDTSSSIQENIDNRTFPYTKIYTAQHVKAWEIDSFGNIDSITFVAEPVKVEKKFGKEIEEEERFIKWDSEKYYILGKAKKGNEPEIIEEYEHGLGIIPVVVLYSVQPIDKSNLLVDPPLYDIARLNHTIFNIDSEIRDQARAQGFAIFYLQTDTPGDLNLGARNVLFVPMNANMQPNFASPDTGILKGLIEYCDGIKEDLYRIAEQSGVTGVATTQSGIAKQWDFFAHESVLKKSSRMAKLLEERVAELFKLWTGEEFEYFVEYPTDFQPNNVGAEIEVIDKAILLGFSPKAEAMLKAKAFRLLSADEDQNEVKIAIEEIIQSADDESRVGQEEQSGSIINNDEEGALS